MTLEPNFVESSGARAGMSYDVSRTNGVRHNSKRNKKNGPSVTPTSTFTGKCEDIKEYVYDSVPGKNGFDVFVKTTREISEYIARTVKDAGEFRVALDPEVLAFTPLTEPTLADGDNNNTMLVKNGRLSTGSFLTLLSAATRPSAKPLQLCWANVHPLSLTVLGPVPTTMELACRVTSSNSSNSSGHRCIPVRQARTRCTLSLMPKPGSTLFANQPECPMQSTFGFSRQMWTLWNI